MNNINRSMEITPKETRTKEARGFSKQGNKCSELLIAENLSLVYNLANTFRKFRYPESELDDLISLGSIGLIKATRTYDEGKNAEFTTHATKYINHEIIMYYRHHYKNWSIASLGDELNNDDTALPGIPHETNDAPENQVVDCVELSEAIQRILNSLDIRTLVIYLADVAGWPQSHVVDKLGITQPYASDCKINAMEMLTYKPRNRGEWEVSYYEGILSIHRSTGKTMHFSIDDALWDNITNWIITTTAMSKLRPNTRELTGKREIKLARIERANEFGNYIVNNSATFRETADFFSTSKSTVHKDVLEVLPKVSPDLYKKVQKVIEKNKAECGIRGGSVTKRRYDEMRARKK